MNNMKAMKRRIPINVLILALIMALISGTLVGTLAQMFFKSDPKINSMNPGTINIKVIENDKDKDGFDPPPGDNVDLVPKKVEIVNEGSGATGTSVYIRVAVIPVFRDSTNHYFGKVSDAQVNSSGVIRAVYGDTAYDLMLDSGFTSSGSKWFYKNGFFYFKDELKSGVKTPPILDHVEKSSVSGSGTGVWDDFNVEVMAEAIQSDGNVDNALALWGVSRNSSGTLVP